MTDYETRSISRRIPSRVFTNIFIAAAILISTVGASIESVCVNVGPNGCGEQYDRYEARTLDAPNSLDLGPSWVTESIWSGESIRLDPNLSHLRLHTTTAAELPNMRLGIPTRMKSIQVHSDGSGADVDGACPSWAVCATATDSEDCEWFMGHMSGHVVLDQQHPEYIGITENGPDAAELTAMIWGLLVAMKYGAIMASESCARMCKMIFDCVYARDTTLSLCRGSKNKDATESASGLAFMLTEVVDASWVHEKGHDGNPWN